MFFVELAQGAVVFAGQEGIAWISAFQSDLRAKKRPHQRQKHRYRRLGSRGAGRPQTVQGYCSGIARLSAAQLLAAVAVLLGAADGAVHAALLGRFSPVRGWEKAEIVLADCFRWRRGRGLLRVRHSSRGGGPGLETVPPAMPILLLPR